MLVKRNTLAEKYFIELISVFKEQNWDIEESISGENSVFDMFCKRLEELESDADRELMLELTRKYLVVALEEYGKYMVNVFRKFIDRNKDKLDICSRYKIKIIQQKQKVVMLCVICFKGILCEDSMNFVTRELG